MVKPLPSIVLLLVRYLGVGLLATLVHYLIFLLLMAAGLFGPLLASVCGGVAGGVVSFFGNRTLCFVTDGRRKFQPVRFALVASAMNIGNAASMALLLGLGMSPLFAQVLVTLILVLLGFSIHRFWTFSNADITSFSRTS